MVGLEFGRFPEVNRLNPRFVPEHDRLKLTLDISVSGEGPARGPGALVEELRQVLPSLGRHRCCGDNLLQETFFRQGCRSDCAMHEKEAAVDIAHLLEHLLIDSQHFIADMRICSGITCGYQRPRHRYDIFVESPDHRVSRLCVALACALMNDLLRGAPVDPVYVGTVRLARHVYRNPSAPITPAGASALVGGDGLARQALRTLSDLGFIREIDTSVNFSRVPLYGLVSKHDGDSPRGGPDPADP